MTWKSLAMLSMAAISAGCASDQDMSTGPAGNLPASPSLVVYSPGTVTVQPSSTANVFTDGWLAGPDRIIPAGASGSAVIGAFPVSQVLGTGSLRLTTASSGPVLGWEAAAPAAPAVAPATPLADISTLSYATYTPSGQAGIAVQAVSLQFTVDYDLNDSYEGFQGRLVYEPYHCNAVSQDVWQAWNTLAAGNGAGCWWQTANPAGSSAPRVGNVAQAALSCPQGNPCTWTEVKAAYPTAGFHRTNAATGVILKIGSSWFGTFYTDAVVAGINGNSTTYDFEPAKQCTMTCYVNGTTGDDAFGGDTPATAKKTIQAAVTQVSASGTVIVAPGTYAENVMIAKNLSLTSSGGRNVTTIDGLAEGSTIRVTTNTTALTIGGAGQGFTIMGKDTQNPAVEQAAVYFQGSHSGALVRDNNIVAGGEAGLMTEFGATIAGFTITGNEFSGKTFVGTNPAGDGFGSQFTLLNVPRQLVVISGGNGGGNTSNITFTNNAVSGTAGGLNSSNAQQGNNLVTIDANVATISGNDFTGFTNRFAHSLRARGPNAAITKNRFIAASPAGVWIGALAAPSSSVTRNAIVGNAAGLVVEATAASPLAATCNWYGAATGPTNAGNPSGTGDPVVGPATFSPWLVSSNLDGACPEGQAPVVSNVAVTPNPAPYTTVSYALTATATDNVAVTSASYTIDGGSPVAFTFTSGASVSLSANIGALAVGVYDICVTAKDAALNTSNTECTILAVYDPSAGFVTGGGWFTSPAGAYAADLDLTGKASFGFVSKYLKGATVPTGNTEFQFHAAGLNFSSNSYEWLVVNQNGTNAQFKGNGSLNGVTGYKFMVWAKDGTPDTFRIRITTASDAVVYDNGELGTSLGGGNIVIHVPKK